MKRASLILIILFSLNSIFFFSQDYDPIIKEGSFWDLTDYSYDSQWSCTYNSRRYQVDYDTIINNKTYKRLKKYIISGTETVIPSCFEAPYTLKNEYTNSNYFIREDLSTKKVFVHTNEFEESTEYKEYLICDFDLELGGTIKNYPTTPGQVKDIELTSIYTKSNGNKEFIYNHGTIIHTEGIGPEFGIVYPFGPTLDSGTNLLCYGNNQNNNNCAEILNTEKISNHFGISFYPNPINDFITIENSPLNSSLDIYSLQGKIIKRTKIEDSNTIINLSSLTKGIYFIRLTHSSSKINKTLKILKL